MSVDYSAYIVIGCAIQPEDLYVRQQIPHRHKVPAGAKFCPECGEPAVAIEDTPLFDEGNDRLGDFDIVWGTDRKIALVGYHIHATEYESVAVIPWFPNDDIMEKTKTLVKMVLEPLGLWREDRFGIWLTLNCSY